MAMANEGFCSKVMPTKGKAGGASALYLGSYSNDIHLPRCINLG